MATISLRPIANSGTTQYTANGAASQWDCVNEVVSDADATYISTTTFPLPFPEYYTATNSNDALTNTDTINSVRVFFRGRFSTGTFAGVRPCIKVGAGETIDTDLSISGSYVNYGSSIFTVVPGTSTPWSRSALNSTLIGTQAEAGNGTLRITQVWIEVDYTPSAQNSIWLGGD